MLLGAPTILNTFPWKRSDCLELILPDFIAYTFPTSCVHQVCLSQLPFFDPLFEQLAPTQKTSLFFPLTILISAETSHLLPYLL